MRLLLLVGALHAVSTVAVDTTVELGYATYIGQEDHDHGLTQWLGIQYAAPPLDDLRFAPPQDPPKKSSPQQADQVCCDVARCPG